MPRFILSFDEGAMTFPDEDLPAVADAAHGVMRTAQAAGVWVFGGGLLDAETTTVVDTDGSVTDGPLAGKVNHLGGFCVIDVPTRDAALAWAARFATACRCAQEVREIMHDPEA